MKCSKTRSNGQECRAQAIDGTDACRVHAGRPLAAQKARGQVVVELSRWGVTDQTLDPGEALLRLMTQSYRRAALYTELLEQAYDAAERLQQADAAVLRYGELGPNADTRADRDRATQDLARVFATGGVAALIGQQYSADKDGGVFATGEAIRGLVTLEAQERDRAAGMAAKAVAAGLERRRVELAEAQGRLVGDVIRAVLTQLGHDLGDPDVLRIVSTQLRALGGAAA